MRISMGLCLGLPLCQSHTCQHCGAEVSQFATHGLSCRKSAGRHHCHSAVNEIVHRALISAHHVWSLQVCIVQMVSDLMVCQLSLGSVGNFWCNVSIIIIIIIECQVALRWWLGLDTVRRLPVPSLPPTLPLTV